MKIRLPAEWEEQDGVLLSWPHENTDWAYILDEVQSLYIELIKQITRFETVLLSTPDPDLASSVLLKAGLSTEKIKILPVSTNDTWTRDCGPVTILLNGRPVIIDFGFNGWGLKFPSDKDNCLTRNLKQHGALLPRVNTVGLILEGGSFESDGNGTILTTSQCLLSPNRNPQLDRSEIEGALASLLGAQKVLWLEHGHLAGDDTDSHIDTLARLCPDDTIIYQACNDTGDEHFEDLKAMEEELKLFKSTSGNPYRLLPLPWPLARHDDAGERLPATYANFLVINGAVLVPEYSDPSDLAAQRLLAEAFPGRKIIGINCLPLIKQHGSLHCITMQLPKGVLL